MFLPFNEVEGSTNFPTPIIASDDFNFPINFPLQLNNVADGF